MIDPNKYEADNESDRKFLRIVADHGWHNMTVLGDEKNAPFGYTTGLYRTYRHPELIVFGLEARECTKLIDFMGTRVKGGEVFSPGRKYDDLLDVPCMFKDCVRDKYKDFLCATDWFYERRPVPVLQCCWPDNFGNFPDAPDFDPEERWLQPCLF